MPEITCCRCNGIFEVAGRRRPERQRRCSECRVAINLERKREAASRKCPANPEHRERAKAKVRERESRKYHTNPEYRERAKAKSRATMALRASRKRAQAEVAPPRVNGEVVFEPVACPRCGDVFRGSRPLHSYSKHRGGAHCPWLDAEEKAAHDTLVLERRLALIRQSQGMGGVEPLPRLHTGHELFDRARAVRRWPDQSRSVLRWPIWEDLLSEGVLALLEDRDPREAMKAFMRSEGPLMLSLHAPAPWDPEHTLLEVLAA